VLIEHAQTHGDTHQGAAPISFLRRRPKGGLIGPQRLFNWTHVVQEFASQTVQVKPIGIRRNLEPASDELQGAFNPVRAELGASRIRISHRRRGVPRGFQVIGAQDEIGLREPVGRPHVKGLARIREQGSVDAVSNEGMRKQVIASMGVHQVVAHQLCTFVVRVLHEVTKRFDIKSLTEDRGCTDSVSILRIEPIAP
jgi:hypothetical protein